jgi:hypothetical protein
VQLFSPARGQWQEVSFSESTEAGTEEHAQCTILQYLFGGEKGIFIGTIGLHKISVKQAFEAGRR